MDERYVWVWDENSRVYDRETKRIIWRKHYRQTRITGETSRSYVLFGGKKLNKKALDGGELWPKVCRSEEEIDRAEWADVHRYRIARRLQHENFSYETLRQIAALVGYEDAEGN